MRALCLCSGIPSENSPIREFSNAPCGGAAIASGNSAFAEFHVRAVGYASRSLREHSESSVLMTDGEEV